MISIIYYGINQFVFCGREQLTHEIHSNEHDFLFKVVRMKNNNRLFCGRVVVVLSVLALDDHSTDAGNRICAEARGPTGFW